MLQETPEVRGFLTAVYPVKPVGLQVRAGLRSSGPGGEAAEPQDGQEGQQCRFAQPPTAADYHEGPMSSAVPPSQDGPPASDSNPAAVPVHSPLPPTTPPCPPSGGLGVPTEVVG